MKFDIINEWQLTKNTQVGKFSIKYLQIFAIPNY